jgi:hypothetical protein
MEGLAGRSRAAGPENGLNNRREGGGRPPLVHGSCLACIHTYSSAPSTSSEIFGFKKKPINRRECHSVSKDRKLNKVLQKRFRDASDHESTPLDITLGTR